jgi:Na+/H+ antiporter NhaD/arsenite permease-like protein
MSGKLGALSVLAIAGALILAELGYHDAALLWILVSSIALLSMAEHRGPAIKIALTTVLGVAGLFVFVAKYGLPPSEDGGILQALGAVSHAIHLEIFLFLAGLYLVVNTFAYAGIIGDMAWKIVSKTRGRLRTILVAIMILTALLSGIFDGATIITIMGVVTLTILLSSGLPAKKIVIILLLLVVATNLGGVWFVLGEPTNILAAKKLSLSPFFFLRWASIFALPAILLTGIVAWRLTAKCPRISPDRPEIEVLLEGLSLRRTHAGTGTLEQTLVSLGELELRHLKEMQKFVEEGMPDFEAALKAGIPKEKVYHALNINLNSEELAQGLIHYYLLREQQDPLADILIGDLLLHVRQEYQSRTASRHLVCASGGLLLGLLMLHALLPEFPIWVCTLIAGLVAIIGIHPRARVSVLLQSWHNLTEAFFLIAIFATVSELNYVGLFARAGDTLLRLGGPEITAFGMLAGSALLSAFADNIAVMDVLTNLIYHHEQWSYFALASVVGTALGGFFSPIASVQAIIMATIIRRVQQLRFGQWIWITFSWFLILLAACGLLLWGLFALGLHPQLPPLS